MELTKFCNLNKNVTNEKDEKMKNENNTEKCRVVTPEFRVSFPHVFKPQAMSGTNNAPKYSITMLFSKDESAAWLKTVINEAKIAKFGDNKAKWPKTFVSPVGDGDSEISITKKTGKPKEGYEGHWVVKASCNAESQPGIVDQHGEPILSASEFYAGCYARAYVYAYVWEFPKDSGKFGVGFILDHVQKLRDGKSFSGKKSVSEVFGPVAGASSSDDETMSEDFT